MGPRHHKKGPNKNKMKFFAYIARCSDNSLYTGYTTNIEKREAKHNKGDGAKYTRSRRPIKIIYFEEYNTRAEAMKREREIKKFSKKRKEQLTTQTYKKCQPPQPTNYPQQQTT